MSDSNIWILSVGSTDIQLPVYAKTEGESGQDEWRLAGRVNIPKSTQRFIHEHLERLAEQDLVNYCTEFSQAFPASDHNAPRLKFDGAGEIIASYESSAAPVRPNHRLTATHDKLRIGRDAPLPLILPKIEPICSSLEAFDTSPPESVLVFNTRRVDDPSEPIAAGPLTARRLATRFDLKPMVLGDPMGTVLSVGSASTSIDLVCGRERFEHEDTLRLCQQRLLRVCRAIERYYPRAHIWLTDSGGAPQIKDLVRRFIRTFFGADRITMLTVGERSGEILIAPSTGEPSWTDGDRTRAAVAEALRARRLVAAYGLASALRDVATSEDSAWVSAVLDTTAALCMLPALSDSRTAFSEMPSCLLVAARCEAAVAQGDVKSLLLQLSTLFEVLIPELLRRHPLFQHSGVRIHTRSNYVAVSSTPALEHIAAGCILFGEHYQAALYHDTYKFKHPSRARPVPLRIGNTHRDVAAWLEWMLETFEEDAPARQAVVALRALHLRFAGSSYSLRVLRNRVMHECASEQTLREISLALLDQALVCEYEGYLSLLRQSDWSDVITNLFTGKSLIDVIDEAIDDLIDLVRSRAIDR